jgi:hypothetical protein
MVLPRIPAGRLRRPEYTGSNRCLPCTVVNLLLAGLLAALLALAAPALALPALGCSLVAIWLRGYLVPGTPALTGRVLPRRVRDRFGHERVGTPVRTAVDADADFDPEATLREAGVLADDPDLGDVRLRTGFAAALRERTPRPASTDRRALAAALGAPGATFERHGNGIVAYVPHTGGGERERDPNSALDPDPDPDPDTDPRIDAVAQWESTAALAADLGAARTLPDWDRRWPARPAAERALLCRSVRTLLEACPVCEGPLAPSASTVESCCASHEVLALTCGDCAARLFETTVT